MVFMISSLGRSGFEGGRIVVRRLASQKLGLYCDGRWVELVKGTG